MQVSLTNIQAFDDVLLMVYIIHRCTTHKCIGHMHGALHFNILLSFLKSSLSFSACGLAIGYLKFE